VNSTAIARTLFPVAVAVAAFLGCAPDRVVQGRPYTITFPKGADGKALLPLVVFLHGFTGNGVWDDQQLVKLAGQVDDKGFIYVQPNGTPNRRGQRYWNAADGCCAPAGSTVDDVAFLRSVIDDVKAQHPIDPARVLFVGYSNGGFMSLRMVCEASELVTAVAIIAGSTWSDPTRCGPGRPVSLLHVHGTGDKTIRFDGSAEDARPPSPVGRYPGARETNARFAARNGCRPTVTPLERIDIEKKMPGTETTPERHEGCPRDGAVELWSMDGAGHFPSFQDGATGRMLDWLLEHPR
jgi:polyhydroxybutyrate depolymerase